MRSNGALFGLMGLLGVLFWATTAWAAGWESTTCGETETNNGVECSLDWCVNQTRAFYICDGLSTAKYDCSGGCGEEET
jgi:hypothetical protein